MLAWWGTSGWDHESSGASTSHNHHASVPNLDAIPTALSPSKNADSYCVCILHKQSNSPHPRMFLARA